MPTKIATIYDKIVTLVEANLTGYRRLPNPYVIDSNTYLHLKQGFGIAIGPGNDTQRYVGCLVTWERQFNITLVREVIALQNNTDARETLEKEFLDDHDALRKAFYLGSSLDGEAIKSTVLSDSGISFIDGENKKFLALELNLFVEYQENPNS